MFTIEMLPAAHGDCLWIEYGSGQEVRRILIDGGLHCDSSRLLLQASHRRDGDRDTRTLTGRRRRPV